MMRSVSAGLAAILIATAMGTHPASAQGQAICAEFMKLREEAQQKALAVKNETAKKAKADRKLICSLVTRFYSAEEGVLKFLVTNKSICGVPEEAITGAKTAHENTLKFKTAICTEAPKPKQPTLSDALTAPIDSSSNTKTGRGTLDSLGGNPLAR
jgi:hypothetical protein